MREMGCAKMKRILALKISGKARQVFRILGLLARDYGDTTIGDIIAEREAK